MYNPGGKIARIREILPTLTFAHGDEYELTLVDRKTGERATGKAAAALWSKLDRPQFPWDQYPGIERANFDKDLIHSIMELNSPVFRQHSERRDWFLRARDFLLREGAEFDLVPIGTDVHPYAWEGHCRREDVHWEPEYLRGLWDRQLRLNNSLGKRLLARLFPPAKSLLVNPFATSGNIMGKHGHHSGYESEAEAFWVLNQFMALLPMFIAGTANGPLCVPATSSGREVVDSGFATLRPGWFRAVKNTGTGPIFRSKEQFQAWLLEQHRLGNLDDRLKLYFWLLRRVEHEVAPDQEHTKPLYTNEYRMAGMLSSPKDIRAWDAAGDAADLLLRCLYRLGIPLSPHMEQGSDEEHVERINADIATAAHDGLDAEITNPFAEDTAHKVKASAAINHFLEVSEPVMDWSHLQEEREHLQWVTDGNAGYQRQLRIFYQEGVDGVLQYLMGEMMKD